ncbi:branched-chain amino acid aminotransferase [Bacillus haikouensis]|uniref:branched-chain amino acid aminotransferase n=1 Tax=Bacillus haikouensis TaxID=1510468 RepID=UPI0015544253|nr:branched-chain amino acid aminotransferase [Bacillus haikouensis]NQD66419.1 branched-chain amino acid aminotransferase [Bacillus haikouensis]
MLKEKLSDFIKKQNEENGAVALFNIEEGYASAHGILEGEVLSEDTRSRFQELIIERCNKESEETVKKESASFLDSPLSLLKSHKDEFLFLNAEWFEIIRIDGISIEIDDVFGHYAAMFGLKLQKKFRDEMEEYLDVTLQDEQGYNLLFNGEDGLWDVNIAINNLPSFSEDLTLKDVIEIIYVYLFEMIEKVTEK